jgi:hypothetical protein
MLLTVVLIGLRRTLGAQQGIQNADRLVVVLVDDVGGEMVVLAAEIDSIGGVVCLLGRAGGGAPTGGG